MAHFLMNPTCPCHSRAAPDTQTVSLLDITTGAVTQVLTQETMRALIVSTDYRELLKHPNNSLFVPVDGSHAVGVFTGLRTMLPMLRR